MKIAPIVSAMKEYNRKRNNSNDAKSATNSTNTNRILFIESNLDGTIGGSHYCLLDLLRGLDKRKFQPFVLFYQENLLIPEFKEICPVIVFDKTKGLLVKRDLPGLFGFAKKNILLLHVLLLCQKAYNFFRYYIIDIFKIVYLLLELKVDLVHINNAPRLNDWLIACKILKVKCIAHLRGHWEPKSLQKRLFKYYDVIISISDSVTNYFVKRGMSTVNFVTIHDGINISAMFNMRKRNPDEIRTEFDPSHNSDFFIGVVGNIKGWKGQHVAIEAVKLLKEKYPHIKCLIIGDVSNLQGDINYFRYLKALVRDNSLSHNITFTGFRKDIPDIISTLDILVHTSVAPEPFGRVILEGMVFSKPVIATAHGGPLEIIEDGISGFLVPPNNPQALAERIEYLLLHPDIAKRIGIAGGKRVKEKFDLKFNIMRTEWLYSTFLK